VSEQPVPAAFALAPMSPGIRGLTVLLLSLPAVFVAASVVGLVFLWGVALVMLVLYAAVWTWWRPRVFELTASALEVRFPGRRRRIPRRDISGARLVSGPQFRREFGWAVRVGAGGLWGGFGWLWTSQRGWVEFYVSRTDDLVLVERRTSRPLLITPERPRALVRALAAP